ncbi:rhodanese-like domain-containing protein [Desulfosporosinus fructosivorans]|uniref:Rhodanese-like domain-containing protein n=1 Tax=Desulfosporosinus fructosivorans TaxID=2018669 RepID=A0A4Z0R5F0_9FIRM|nr:rhodanese-like domain-containing protein [Desulfosporosinus fructosivorans]TGE38028.1 rhodanese-like domain-containing protein [Desulfosporosinus fructosivorans]
MRAESMSMRSLSLTVIYLLLLGFGMTFLVGCGTSPSTVVTVDKVQDPPKVNSSQNATSVQGDPAEAIPTTATISVGDLDAAITANKGWQLIDIREAREFATGHIKMALNRPMGDLENNLAQISKDKNIVLIDLNGTRAQTAWHVLVEKGYDQNKVKVLTGGMLQWRGIVSSAGSGSSGKANGGDSADTPKPEAQEMVGGC